MDDLLSRGKGAKELVKLFASPVRKKRISAMTDAAGNRKTGAQDMAEVFACFYEEQIP